MQIIIDIDEKDYNIIKRLVRIGSFKNSKTIQAIGKGIILPKKYKILSDDKILELAKEDRPISREELGLTPSSENGFNVYKEI